jgi:hypothetical protein
MSSNEAQLCLRKWSTENVVRFIAYLRDMYFEVDNCTVLAQDRVQWQASDSSSPYQRVASLFI